MEGEEAIVSATLQIDGVGKTYRRPDTVQALCDVSLRVEPGRFHVVQGPSGSGKTTLLLAAGGLLAPDAGVVRVDGQDLYALSAEHRARFRAEHIGYVFQQFHLIPYLSVLDNVLAACLALRRPGARERAGQLIAELGLAGRARHFPSELSTGERQRTALARALLNDPRLILADEPTGNLDRRSAQVVLAHLRDFARRGGAVLMATHQSDVPADEVLHLDGGTPAGGPETARRAPDPPCEDTR
ncbi:MAG: ABC transporter ATP-binding protein [Candidatus Brocadiaceae bacterium]|nr:ABC transporter ATP-binding protein [Candidatus Brocadiaceae bacterium]